ncbi:RHS repeat-associated core domain-containing protein [Paenibacillus rigui]|nr:RHS repeat-associated core domain-containing protein [Paenibacillus rigui]
MTDGRGKVTQYGYGAFGWMQAATNAASLSIRYQYDLAGNVTGITDRMDHHIAYTYDSRNLLLNKQVKETGDALSYSYDEAGNRLTMSDDSGTSSYTYDKKNQLLNISRDGAVQISYTYDAAGNIESVIDKTGAATTYTYDKSNRMETVVFKGHTTTYSYDENGNRQAISYEGGVKEEYSFDRNNRVVTLTNHKPNGDVISSYSYTYDAAGRIAKVEAPGKTTVYAYDGSGNRQTLNETYTSVQPSGYFDPNTKVEVQYKVKKSEYVYSNTNELLKLVEAMYDEAGTELLEKTTSYQYDENGNQIRQKVGYIHPHNRSMRQVTGGNPYGDNVTDELNTLIEKVNSTYDGFNQLKQMEKLKAGERVTVDYTYNGDGLRTKKVVRSSKDNYAEKVTNYLYDRQHVVLETDASDQMIVRYVRGINYIARADSSDKLSYYLYNGHGDVVQTVSAAGEVENQYDYDVFGNPTLTVETGYTNAIRYAGEFMDVETGLYYLRARYYDPYTGRFMSQDSYWGEDTNPLSLNLYTYGHNNPIMYIDPSGHSVLSSILTSIVVGAVVKAVVDYVTGNSSSSSSGSSRSSRGGGSSQAAEKAKSISKEIQKMMSKAADVVFGVKGSSVISQGNSAVSYGNARDREFSSLLKSSLPTTIDMLNDYLMILGNKENKKHLVRIASIEITSGFFDESSSSYKPTSQESTNGEESSILGKIGKIVIGAARKGGLLVTPFHISGPSIQVTPINIVKPEPLIQTQDNYNGQL